MTCPFEPLVGEALRAGGWPHGVETSLVAHVSACGQCAEVVTVTRLLMAEWEATRREAPLPAAEVIWWRAQLRARQEAARMAALPVQVALGIALAAACGLLAAFGDSLLAWIAGQVSIAGSSLIVEALSIEPPRFVAASPFTIGVIVLALVAAAVLAPVAVYVAGERD